MKTSIRSIVLLGKSVLAAQGGRCWLCEKPMRKPPGTKEGWLNGPFKEFATQDHVVPRSVLKGAGIPNNKLWAHHTCNNKRGNRLPDDTQRRKARMILIGAVAYQLAIKETKHV